MKKFKVIVCSILIVLMLVSGAYLVYIFARPSENKKVIATIFPIYDIAREIMGSSDDLMFLEGSGADMHSYNPTSNDIMAIHKSELFIYIGGESDDWVGSVLKSSENPNLKTLCLLDEIKGIEESDDNIIQDNDHHHDEHDDNSNEVNYDEHIWLSIKNAIQMTEKIRQSLTLVFPERQELFKVNASKYIEKLESLESEYSSFCRDKSDTLIIADRFPFIYLTSDYDINYYACFSGCSTETQASAETISSLIDKINTCDAETVLVLESSDRSVANSVIIDSRCKSGVGIATINSCQSISKSQIEKTSYLQIMKENLEVIKRVLKK